MKRCFALILALCLTLSAAAAAPAVQVTALRDSTLSLKLTGFQAGQLVTALYRAGKLLSVSAKEVSAGDGEGKLTLGKTPAKGDILKAFLLQKGTSAPLMEAAELTVPREPGKVLVAYFSCTNTTKGVAEKIAQAAGGDLFEIVPETPYTKADLNYSASCRANDEQRDEAAMPAIAAHCKVEGWESYDVVFLGHPIWWGIPPKILRTFCEQYDWTGKTVVGFCTSGGSPYSNTGLPERTAGADWKDTRRLNGATQATVEEWVESLELTQKEESKMDKLTVTFNGHTYTATLADNPGAAAFAELLRQSPVTIHAHDFGGWEKVGALGAALGTANDVQTHTVSGDFVLYAGDQIVLFYGSNDWSYTPLGHLEGDLASLQAHLGSGDVDITYALAK